MDADQGLGTGGVDLDQKDSHTASQGHGHQSGHQSDEDEDHGGISIANPKRQTFCIVFSPPPSPCYCVNLYCKTPLQLACVKHRVDLQLM